MAGTVLLDNWLLQHVSSLLTDGPSPDVTRIIEVDEGRTRHTPVDVPKAALQVEGLINLVVDVVLRETLVLDERYAHTWNGRPNPLDWLGRSGVIDLRALDPDTPRGTFAKERALEALCATPDLREIQRRNEEAFARTGAAEEAYYSAVLWGTAGNLGRSAESELPYSPHPARRHLMRQTLFRPPSAGEVIDGWLRHERAQVYGRSAPGAEHRLASLVLPPVAVEVIAEARSLEDLVPIALQVRDRYHRLRGFVQTFQDALDDEDGRALLRHRRVLESVAAHLAGKGDGRFGQTSLALGVGWFRFGLPIPGPGDLVQRVGVRGTLNRLVLTPAGQRALLRLVEMIGEGRTRLGSEVRAHLQRVFAAGN